MDVKLFVDGENIVLTGYPSSVIAEIFSGILRTLHGVDPETWERAELTMER